MFLNIRIVDYLLYFFIWYLFGIFFFLLLKLNSEILGIMILMVYTSGILILLIYLCAIYEFKFFPPTTKMDRGRNDKHLSYKTKNWQFNIVGIIAAAGFILLFYPIICYFDNFLYVTESSFFYCINICPPDNSHQFSTIFENINNSLSIYLLLFDGIIYKIGVLLCSVYILPFLFIIILFFIVLLGISVLSYSGPTRHIYSRY